MLVSNLRQSVEAAVRVENTIPILRVRDLQLSIDYYVRCLGFELDWRDTRMASVSRDGQAIMLADNEQGCSGTWVWIGVSDAAELCREIAAKGATIRSELRNYPWAHEILVEDPDDHVLRFGSDPLEEEPFEAWPDES